MKTLLVDAGGTNIRSAWTNENQRIWGERTQVADTFESLTDALQNPV